MRGWGGGGGFACYIDRLGLLLGVWNFEFYYFFFFVWERGGGGGGGEEREGKRVIFGGIGYLQTFLGVSLSKLTIS